jgi:hypothetical protein
MTMSHRHLSANVLARRCYGRGERTGDDQDPGFEGRALAIGFDPWPI